MTKLAALVVRIADLAEAEGRTLLAAARLEGTRLNASVAHLAVRLAFLAAATALALVGVGLVAYGAFLLIEPPLGRPGSAIVTGAAFFIIAGVCVWMFKRTTAR